MATGKTGTYMNWVNVSVTPAGGTAIGIGRVTMMSVKRSAKNVKFYGDNYSFATVIKATERERGITISSGNLAALAQIPEDTPCTVTGTLLDPRNGITSGGGAITVTLINAFLDADDSSGTNNKFADGKASFSAIGGTDSNGNETDPLTIAYI